MGGSIDASWQAVPVIAALVCLAVALHANLLGMGKSSL